MKYYYTVRYEWEPSKSGHPEADPGFVRGHTLTVGRSKAEVVKDFARRQCACLVGTIANLKHCEYRSIPSIRPDAGRPIERFFLSIRQGDTPDNSQPCAIVVTWIDEWLSTNRGSNAPTIPSV